MTKRGMIFVACVLLGLAALSLSPVGVPDVSARQTSITCNNSSTDSWSPAPGIGVTITVFACVAVSGGYSWGVHGVTASSNNTSLVPQSSSGQLQGYESGCFYYCPKEYYYLKNFNIGQGKLPNISYITGPFPVWSSTTFNENALACVFTYALSFKVLYSPTGQTHDFYVWVRGGPSCH